LLDEGVQLIYEPFGWLDEWYIDVVRIQAPCSDCHGRGGTEAFPGIQVPPLTAELFPDGLHRLRAQSQAERRFSGGDRLDDGERDPGRVVGLAS